MSRVGRARRALFGIPSAQAVFSRPGFAPEAWTRFRPVAESLMEGYHRALEDPHPARLAARLDQVEPDWRGVAYEGAGMGLAALDAISPWSDRVTEFAEGPGARHLYPFYVGVGLAYARLHHSPESHLDRLDPLLGWVVADGYGFHEAFFRRAHYVDGRAVPLRLTAYARRMFDQGLGRAIWFSSGAGVDTVTATVDRFPAPRRPDLWSGVGLAAAYCGGTSADGLRALRRAAGPHEVKLARGAATAAWGHEQAEHTTGHTALACEVLCQASDREAAGVVERARRDLPLLSVEPAHEIWRRRVEDELARELAGSSISGGHVVGVPC